MLEKLVNSLRDLFYCLFWKWELGLCVRDANRIEYSRKHKCVQGVLLIDGKCTGIEILIKQEEGDRLDAFTQFQ